MTTDDLQRYFKKSGDSNLLAGELLENEHGFMVFDVLIDMHGTSFRILHAYGDGKYWQALAERMAKRCRCDRIVVCTKRNPHGFIRRHGYSIVGYILGKEL